MKRLNELSISTKLYALFAALTIIIVVLAGVAVFSSRAALLNKIALPAQHHSNLAISPDGKFLFVTSIDEEPGGDSRGGLLKVRNPLAPR